MKLTCKIRAIRSIVSEEFFSLALKIIHSMAIPQTGNRCGDNGLWCVQLYDAELLTGEESHLHRSRAARNGHRMKSAKR